MAKYIDADTVVSMPFLDDSYVIEEHTMETDTIENLLDRFTKEGCPEPADVVPVVRCGQCGYWHDNDGDYGYCYAKDGQGFGHAWRKNDFCSYGERKEKYEID